MPTRKLGFLVVAVLSILSLSACDLPNQLSSKINPAELQVESTPSANVYINDKLIGQTPLTDRSLHAGTYTIALKSSDGTWADQITLYPSAVTIVNRDLAAGQNGDSGDVIELQEGNGIDVIGSPTDAAVFLDDQQIGNIPVSVNTVAPGQHQLRVQHDGYTSRTLSIQITKGYKTEFNIALAPAGTANSSTNTTPSSAAPSALPSSTAKPSVSGGQATIGNTGAGWLRVHISASGASAEAFRVNTGDVVTIEGTQGVMTKIKTANGQEGWVVSQYLVQ